MAQYGGFDEDFVGTVRDILICHICTKPLRDPHLTVCCGHNFCESCLEQWSKKQRENSCPFCRSAGEEFQHFLDKKTKREINALKVRCSNRMDGCKWIGELGALKKHLNSADGCGYVYVQCPNDCCCPELSEWESMMIGETDDFQPLGSKFMLRKNLQHHLKVECEERPYRCEHCGEIGTFKSVTEYHYPTCPEFPVLCPNGCTVKPYKLKEMPEHRKICPLEKVGCPFAAEGCSARKLVRKDEAEHMEKNIVSHQLLMLKSSQERSKRDKEEWERAMLKMKKEWDQKVAVITKNLDSLLVTCSEKQKLPLQSIRSVIDDSYCLKLGGVPLSLQVTNFYACKQSSGVWYSAPFYLSEITGLKLRLAVYPNGIKSGARTHVSLVVQCLQRDLKEPIVLPCGSYIRVDINSTFSTASYQYAFITSSFCRCENSHEIWVSAISKGGMYNKEKFLPHKELRNLCHNNSLTLIVSWLRCINCDCGCHESDSYDDL